MEKCFLEKKLLPITVHPIQRFLLSSFARHEHNILELHIILMGIFQQACEVQMRYTRSLNMWYSLCPDVQQTRTYNARYALFVGDNVMYSITQVQVPSI